MKGNLYKIKSLYEAAVLNTSGQKLKVLERTGGPPHWFFFEGKRVGEQLVEVCLNNEATVKVKAYADERDNLFPGSSCRKGDYKVKMENLKSHFLKKCNSLSRKGIEKENLNRR